MKKKIVYIGSNLPDKTPAGVRVFANALALRDYGYDVKLISKDQQYQIDYDINEGLETWHLHRPNSTKEWISALIDANPYIRIIERIGDVETIITYEPPSIVYLKLCRFCRRKGIKLICEAAEWQKWENLGGLNFVARIVRLLDINISMRYAYKKGNGLILSSHFFSNQFDDSLPKLVLPTLQCRKLNITKNETANLIRKFIYAGGIGYGKDMLRDIILAFSAIPERQFKFNILGLTKTEFTERFPNDAEAINIINQKTEKIKFWGKVSHNDVLVEVSKSDFALIVRDSSFRNNIGFPTKFGESINCGTPVIVSDFSDVVYYTKKYDVGIVTETNNIRQGINTALDMDNNTLLDMRKRCSCCQAFYYKGHIDEIGGFVERIINN